MMLFNTRGVHEPEFIMKNMMFSKNIRIDRNNIIYLYFFHISKCQILILAFSQHKNLQQQLGVIGVQYTRLKSINIKMRKMTTFARAWQECRERGLLHSLRRNEAEIKELYQIRSLLTLSKLFVSDSYHHTQNIKTIINITIIEIRYYIDERREYSRIRSKFRKSLKIPLIIIC